MTKSDFNYSSKDSERLVTLFSNKKYDELSKELLDYLKFFERNTFYSLSLEDQSLIDDFISCFLFLFTREQYIIKEQDGYNFIRLNPVVSNLVAISSHKNTDVFLSAISHQNNNLVKLLTLYSARNKAIISRELLFGVNPQLTSLWYSAFFGNYYSICSEHEAYRHLQKHLEQIDSRLCFLYEFQHMMYASSYIHEENDKLLKSRVNKLLKTSISKANVKINNKPKKNKLAVISNRWFKGHSVHRNQYDYLKALKEDYELVLIHLGDPKSPKDESLFSEVKNVFMTAIDKIDITQIQDNDFAAVYYPDSGMSMEAIFLANMRIAPVQITSYGHSVSTFGSEIDYWIGGVDVELESQLTNNYSEKVVLIPGLGITNIKPNYEPRFITPRQDKIIINCSWYPQKINYKLLQTLQTILFSLDEKESKNIVFRLFCGTGLQQQNNFIPFMRNISTYFPQENIEVLPSLSYYDYMSKMEEGTFSIDAYHYGGCNTVVDSLYIRKPIVTQMGTKWYNRIGGGILTKVGTTDLIASDNEEYVDLVVRMIKDKDFRDNQQNLLNNIDLDTKLFDCGQDGINFKKAIDYIVENNEFMKSSKEPIYME